LLLFLLILSYYNFKYLFQRPAKAPKPAPVVVPAPKVKTEKAAAAPKVKERRHSNADSLTSYRGGVKAKKGSVNITVDNDDDTWKVCLRLLIVFCFKGIEYFLSIYRHNTRHHRQFVQRNHHHLQ
jgi:hypothetical protein